MMEEREKRDGSRFLLLFLTGGLVGAVISLLYAPLSGEKTRQYLRIQTERARRKARHLTEDIKENVEHIVDEIKETIDKIIEEGIALTKEKRAEILAAIEAGKKAMEEERERLEKLHTERNEK